MAEKAHLALIAEANHIALRQFFCGLDQRLPARAVETLDQRRLDPRFAVAADAAARNLEAENARYLQGLAIPVDLTTAQLNSFTAQSNEIQALYDYYIAQAQLKQALGQ